MSLFRPNIENTGRVFRAVGALTLGTVAFLVCPHSRLAAGALGAGVLFMAFEAARGWCALRACGIRTKL